MNNGTKTTRDGTLPQHKCTDCPSASSITFHCDNVSSDIIHLIPPTGNAISFLQHAPIVLKQTKPLGSKLLHDKITTYGFYA